MVKLGLLFLFTTQVLFGQESQPVATYKNGHNGMELIITTRTQTIIISTFNSKMELKEDIAEKLYALFKDNKCQTGESIRVEGNDAKVTGKCFITKKGDLTSVNFYYDRIEWNTGLVEIHQDELQQKI